MASWIKALDVTDLSGGEGKCVEANGKDFAVFALDNEYFAFEDFCPHSGAPLSEGCIEDGEVVCPWHGARFQVQSGDVTQGPAREGIKRLNTKVEDGALFIEIPD
ncbi:MAG: Rieske 2Fe-2S domain-containing protein [bacterium]|nr:Rieske 2Fe-2S domain-containing protein [bacterium]